MRSSFAELFIRQPFPVSATQRYQFCIFFRGSPKIGGSSFNFFELLEGIWLGQRVFSEQAAVRGVKDQKADVLIHHPNPHAGRCMSLACRSLTWA